MQYKNTEERFGLIAILFHWLIAIFLIGVVILGLYMTTLPVSLEKLKLYGWHKEYGILILILATARFVWRILNTTPNLNELTPWEKMAAWSVHWLFYLLMFALPITGWLMSSTAGLTVSFFGWFLLPNLMTPNETVHLFLRDLHHWLGYVLIVIFFGHVMAALKHQFINKDTILRRMFP